MNKLIKLVSGLSFVPFLVLTVATILAYHQRIGMYFWHDDYTIIYRFQQNIPIKFPYQFDAILVKLLYGFFGLEYWPYAVINIVLTIGVTYLVYILASMLFRNKTLSLLSTLIFTHGYVGQEETLQLIAAGLDTTLAMGMLLAALIFFLKYFNTFGKIWLFLTYVFFFLTLEIGADRYGTAVLIFIAVDWMLLLKAKRKRLFPVILRNLTFIFLFSLEYIFHITRAIFEYPLSYQKEASLFRLQNLGATQLQYLGNLIGTFWNILFPRVYQDWLYAFFLKLPIFKDQILWTPILPILMLFVLILVLIRLLRKNTISSKKFYSYVLLFLLTSLVWATVVITTTSFINSPVSRISVISGGIFFLFLSTLLFMKVPASTFNALFSLVLFSILLTFLYTQKMWYVYDSTQRYLFSVSFAPAFLPAFFITRELYNKTKNIRVKSLAWLIFLLPTLLLIIFPLLAGIKTQKNFRENYSKHAIRFYTDLERYIPGISSKKAIYVEGATKELNFSSFDAVRVGGLPSEAAIAVHYRTPMESIILPKEPGDVSKLLEQHADLSPDNVYYFIYSDGGLENNSKEFRQLLQTKSTPIVVNPRLWQVQQQESLVGSSNKELVAKTTYFELFGNSLGIYPTITFQPKEVIKTQLPLLIKLDIKAKLPNSLPVPYHQLFNRPGGAPRALWQEILSWEIRECKKGTIKGIFECVEQESQATHMLKNGVKEGEVEISWDYDSYGRLSLDKKTVLKVPLDGMWHKHEFTIPASGLYLNSLIINYISFPGTIYIGNMQIEHVS